MHGNQKCSPLIEMEAAPFLTGIATQPTRDNNTVDIELYTDICVVSDWYGMEGVVGLVLSQTSLIFYS